MQYDDGSSLDPTTGVVTEAPMGMLPGDVRDAAAMGQFGNNGAPWYQNVIQYGLVRAIDNRYGPVGVGGNMQAGTFGGANGRTYGNTGSNTYGRTVSGQDPMSGLLMLALVGLVVYAVAN
jgi:hypothetical protein